MRLPTFYRHFLSRVQVTTSLRKVVVKSMQLMIVMASISQIATMLMFALTEITLVNISTQRNKSWLMWLSY